MKIIDQQGRLFGKINIIDLIFLILVIGIIAAGAKRMTQDPIPAESTGTAEIVLHVKGIGEVGAEAICEGQKLYHYDTNEYMGEIKSVEVEPFVDSSRVDGQWVEAENPNVYLVILTIEGPVTKGDINTMTGSENLLIGSEYRLKSNVSTFAGTCMGFSILD